MRITRVYTRTGDKGTTGLVGGKRVRKDHVRIEAYGTVDELSCVLGLARTFNGKANGPPEATTLLDKMLRIVQNDLFDVGADLATPADARWENMRRVGDQQVKALELWIDGMNKDLGPLKEFVLPGGGPTAAFLHQARTVCRRAERVVVRLMEEEQDVGSDVLRYLNRLSDALFVAARWVAKQQGEAEYMWERERP
jgi:cob(I)alamin adenosyltransferase